MSGLADSAYCVASVYRAERASSRTGSRPDCSLHKRFAHHFQRLARNLLLRQAGTLGSKQSDGTSSFYV